MIFPIGDTQVKGGFRPFISYVLIGLLFLTFIAQNFFRGKLICSGAVIPQHIANHQDLYTLITAQFLHGNLIHLLGNALFIWIFADNIEAAIGHVRFLAFYLLGGIIATFAHIWWGTTFDGTENCCIPCSDGAISCLRTMKACSAYIPTLGASGAISAVIGAYIVMYPKSRIKILVLFLFRNFYVPAWFFLVLWFLIQLVSGLGSYFKMDVSGLEGVAWWAHIGGFVFGVVMGLVFKNVYKFDPHLEE